MNEFFSLIILGIALSMDAFSLALGVGTFMEIKKKILLLSIIVGIFHFIMPVLGDFIGFRAISFLNIEASILFGIIIILIAIEIIMEIIKKEEKIFELSYLNMLIFALSVSIDSFTTGMGLSAITDNLLLAGLIFSICSFVFTYIGLLIGNIGSKYLGIYANIFGIILLLILGIKSFFV